MVKQKEIKVPVQVLVSSQFLKNGKAQGLAAGTEELIRVHKFVTEPAKVSVEYGMLINTGNYESARIGVQVTVPCYLEEIDTAYKWASKWAEERVNKEKDAIRKAVLASAGDLE